MKLNVQSDQSWKTKKQLKYCFTFDYHWFGNIHVSCCHVEVCQSLSYIDTYLF